MAQVPASKARSRLHRRGGLAVVAVLAGLVAAAVFVLLPRHPPSVTGPPARPPGLGDLWAGRASLVLDRRWSSAALHQPGGGIYSGAAIAAVGRRWYLFDRRTEPRPGCPGGVAMGTQVRASADRGATWGPPVTIVAPAAGTPWACAATDGDAVYDARTGTWRLLFQCMGDGGVWNGCYAERRDASPLGPFSAPGPGANPVIPGGSLWRRICGEPDDACHGRSLVDEGTFALLADGAGGWWVGFHGTDGVHGYRGIARTTTFRAGDWRVDGEDGTPRDAVLTPASAAGWRESWAPGGPVGTGAAALTSEGGWFYQLAEVPDRSLACTPGQHWDLGLFRAREPSSIDWQQYPAGNPIFYSNAAPAAGGVPLPCNVEYPMFLHDPISGRDYVMFGRMSDDLKLDRIDVYRVEWDRNLLTNGDFWRDDTAGWAVYPGTSVQMEAQRTLDASPDGTPWLSLSCPGACRPGASVYQDFSVPAGLAGRRVAFGGSFRVDVGHGMLAVVLFQFDTAGRVVATDTLRVHAGARFAVVRRQVEIDRRARRLRFQIYPDGSAHFAADDLFVIPQDGCSGPRYPAC